MKGGKPCLKGEIIALLLLYNCLRNSLFNLCREIRELQEVLIDDKLIKLEYYLGDDWKFLANVCGIGAANSTYACIWCCCRKKERGDRSRKSSLMDKKFGARTVTDIVIWSKRHNFSVKRPPIFDVIPLHHVVVDLLHLFLRIFVVLIA